MAAGVVTALATLLAAAWTVPPLPNSRMVTVVCWVAAAAAAVPTKAVKLIKGAMNFILLLI